MSRYISVDDMRGIFCQSKSLTQAWNGFDMAPTIDIVRCKECIYYDPPHVEEDGKRIEYADLPKEAFDELGTGFVSMEYGINVGGRCTVDYNIGYDEDKRVFRTEDGYCYKGIRGERRKP